MEVRTMPDPCCGDDKARGHPLMQALRQFGEDLRRSEVRQHLRGVKRESLLVMRSLIDVCIAQLGGEEDSKAEEADAQGRRIPVD